MALKSLLFLVSLKEHWRGLAKQEKLNEVKEQQDGYEEIFTLRINDRSYCNAYGLQ
jgi:hypothetical protein